jgi:hypothetical protein
VLIVDQICLAIPNPHQFPDVNETELWLQPYIWKNSLCNGWHKRWQRSPTELAFSTSRRWQLLLMLNSQLVILWDHLQGRHPLSTILAIILLHRLCICVMKPSPLTPCTRTNILWKFTHRLCCGKLYEICQLYCPIYLLTSV